MAVGLASGFANSILDGICNNTDPSNLPVATPFIKLHVGDPGSAGTGNAAGNTTRKSVSFGAASGGVCSNDTAISWTSGEVTTSEDYTHWSLWTASSGGTFIGSGTLTANPVTAGDTFDIAIGDLDLSFNTAA
jgi:hypothetical protein